MVLSKNHIFYLLITVLCFGLFFSCSKNTTKDRTEQIKVFNSDLLTRINKINELIQLNSCSEAIDKYVSSLSLQQKISQMFLVNLSGNRFYSSDSDVNKDYTPGGVLLFSYNIADSSNKVINYLASIQDYYIKKNSLPPFISIDHEGGTVNRLRKICSTLPSSKEITERISTKEAYELYLNQANQLNALGINVNLAPVIEIQTEDNKDFLGTRTFGSLDNVSKYASKAISAYSEAGVYSVVKHFPGNTNEDPHNVLPKINVSYDEFYNLYLLPFKKVFEEDNTIGVLMSHVDFAEFSDNIPSCLSSKMINEYLVETLDYQGLVFSDDICMSSLVNNGYKSELSVIMAIDSGVNIIMTSDKIFYPLVDIIKEHVLTNDSLLSKIEESNRKIIKKKIDLKIIQLVDYYPFGKSDNFFPGFPVISKKKISIDKSIDIKERNTIFYTEKAKGEKLYNSLFTN